MERIDFVITYVDGADPNWLKKRAEASGEGDSRDIRFRDWETLKYWFRGAEKFADFFGKIYLITDSQIPNWLNTDNERLVVVKHEDYLPNEALPTFNSNVIELNMHRIEGLSGRFVYFNDDMILCKKINRTDFFKGGVPCQTAALSPVVCYENGDFSAMQLNNAGVINSHFKKSEVLKKHLHLWFNPKMGTAVFRTVCMLPWRHFTGFFETHAPSSFLKSTFCKVWEAEGEYLNEMNTRRFRDNKNDLNQWLIKNWQACEGNFHPQSPNFCGSYTAGKDAEKYLDAIKKGKHKIVCINDVEEIDFEYEKKRLIKVLEEILPDASGFEKE